VNAPHSAPHVLGLLSWMVNYVDFGSDYAQDDVFSFDDAFQLKLLQANLDYIHNKEAENASQIIDDIAADLVTFCEQHYGVTDHDIEQLQAQLRVVR